DQHTFSLPTAIQSDRRYESRLLLRRARAARIPNNKLIRASAAAIRSEILIAVLPTSSLAGRDNLASDEITAADLAVYPSMPAARRWRTAGRTGAAQDPAGPLLYRA